MAIQPHILRAIATAELEKIFPGQTGQVREERKHPVKHVLGERLIEPDLGVERERPHKRH